jgi:NAD(P)-dependent dehydrogenase (short-subunit alcohol dehydrogenase family)
MADVEMFVGEVEDDQAARALVETAVDHYGGVDVVVNNAGVVHQKVLAKMTPAEFDEEIAVNLRGTWSVSRHAIAAMKESGGGLLLQIASQSAFTGTIGQTGYAASKAGVIGMMCAWDEELSSAGIRVNALCPTAVSGTSIEFIGRLQAAARKRDLPVPSAEEIGFGNPKDIAELVALLCSPACAHLRSQIIAYNGRNLTLWTHPTIGWVKRRDSWTVESLTTALADGGYLVARPTP